MLVLYVLCVYMYGVCVCILSNHLPIIITINIRNDYRLHKTDKHLQTTRKQTGHNLPKTQTESAFAHTTIHTANIIFTNIILMADKHSIPKGKAHSNFMLLADHIACKITKRNNTRRENACDPALKCLKEEITSDIYKHKQNLWKEHLDAHWDHRQG